MAGIMDSELNYLHLSAMMLVSMAIVSIFALNRDGPLSASIPDGVYPSPFSDDHSLPWMDLQGDVFGIVTNSYSDLNQDQVPQTGAMPIRLTLGALNAIIALKLEKK